MCEAEGKGTLKAQHLCTHPPPTSKSLGSKCLVPMATRQLVTSKLFQPPGTTFSLTGDYHKPQVLKQRLKPTRDSLLEVIRRFAYLMSSAARSSGKAERYGAMFFCNWLKGQFPCRK